MITQIKKQIEEIEKGCGRVVVNHIYEYQNYIPIKDTPVYCHQVELCDACQIKLTQAKKDLDLAEKFIEELKERLIFLTHENKVSGNYRKANNDFQVVIDKLAGDKI